MIEESKTNPNVEMAKYILYLSLYIDTKGVVSSLVIKEFTFKLGDFCSTIDKIANTLDIPLSYYNPFSLDTIDTMKALSILTLWHYAAIPDDIVITVSVNELEGHSQLIWYNDIPEIKNRLKALTE